MNNTAALDQATQNLTAFNTWEAFLDACLTGWVPTIKGKSADATLLRAGLWVHGCQAWAG